ncbi:MAG: Asp-tRNA(Asn)/Glu-tRNA(Gln) amidotransferase subunit GatC [Candidatus Methylacidiphilales bacterium]
MTSPTLDVAYVADLARMELSPDELALFQKQLADILGYVNQLQQVDVSSVPDTPIDPHLPTNVLRHDHPSPGLSTAEALANAPAQANSLITVPKIVE